MLDYFRGELKRPLIKDARTHTHIAMLLVQCVAIEVGGVLTLEKVVVEVEVEVKVGAGGQRRGGGKVTLQLFGC